jgi:hypothetical protein
MPELDAQLAAQLCVSLDGLAAKIGGLTDRYDQTTRLRGRAAQVIRQVPFIINVPLTAGAATINPSTAGPDIGYYWSIRKLAAVNFTAGTVNTYIDNTGGEPIVPFPVQAVNTFGKMEQVLNPGSAIAIVAAGITGTVQIWGKADQFESWALPWYMGTYSDLA